MSAIKTRFLWKGELVQKAVAMKAVNGLSDAAEVLLDASDNVPPQVPHDEGTLEESGATSVDHRRLMSAVSYDTPYARDQHENEEYHHRPNQGAKFLEAKTKMPDVQRRCLMAMREQVKRAFGQ